MADGDHCVATVEVKVLIAAFVPNVRAFCLCNGDVVNGVDVKKFHIFYICSQRRKDAKDLLVLGSLRC